MYKGLRGLRTVDRCCNVYETVKCAFISSLKNTGINRVFHSANNRVLIEFDKTKIKLHGYEFLPFAFLVLRYFYYVFKPFVLTNGNQEGCQLVGMLLSGIPRTNHN